MDDSLYELTYFLVWPLPGTAMGILCNCLVGAFPTYQYTLRGTIISLVPRNCLPRAKIT